MSKTLLITCIVFAAASQVWCHDSILMGDDNLANAILRSSESIGNNPGRSVECFGVYLPLLTDATNRYEKEYEKCIKTSEAAAQAIEAEVASSRTKVSNDGEEICGLFSKCSGLESLDFFSCNHDASGIASTKSYEIQTLSKNRMQYIANEQKQVEYNKAKCTDKCADAYATETNRLYGQLEACLAGQPNFPVVPTEEPETTMGTTYWQ